MSDKVKMVALLTIPKRKMQAGQEYQTDTQTALDDVQFGRGKPVETPKPVAQDKAK
jgi:hypothetical protein